jgi:hypothetical protein
MQNEIEQFFQRFSNFSIVRLPAEIPIWEVYITARDGYLKAMLICVGNLLSFELEIPQRVSSPRWITVARVVEKLNRLLPLMLIKTFADEGRLAVCVQTLLQPGLSSDWTLDQVTSLAVSQAQCVGQVVTEVLAIERELSLDELSALLERLTGATGKSAATTPQAAVDDDFDFHRIRFID